jgi:hypothetical protein
MCMSCFIPKPFNKYKTPFCGIILYGACNIKVVLMRQTTWQSHPSNTHCPSLY